MNKKNIVKVLKIIMMIILIAHGLIIVIKGVSGYLGFKANYGEIWNIGIGISFAYILPYLIGIFMIMLLTIELIKSMRVEAEKKKTLCLFLSCILCQIGFYIIPIIVIGIICLIQYFYM